MVFDPDIRPWVNMDNATTHEIVEQVHKCPSHALKAIMNSEKQNNEQ